MNDDETEAAPFVPTPEEIAREAAAIRAEWSPEVEQARRVAGCRRQDWHVPHVSAASDGD